MICKDIPKLDNNNIIRFIEKIEFSSGCWTWKGCCRKGQDYGEMRIYGDSYRIHRVSYEFFRSEKIPQGMVLDHLCRNRRCVNPFHLEAVSVKENNLRGVGSPAVNSRKTHCKRGHEFKGKNLYYSQNHRSCRTCQNMRQRKYQGRKISSVRKLA